MDASLRDIKRQHLSKRRFVEDRSYIKTIKGMKKVPFSISTIYRFVAEKVVFKLKHNRRIEEGERKGSALSFRSNAFIRRNEENFTFEILYVGGGGGRGDKRGGRGDYLA